MQKLFGTDGIRGVANTALTAELAMAVGRGLVKVLKDSGISRPTLMIGMDTRLSSDMLSSSLEAGICSAGGNVINAGVCSTPAVAYLLRKHKCDGGVMISASHNPYEYNGIKIFGADGYKLSDEMEETIEKIIEENSFESIGHSDIGTKSYLSEAVDEYIEYLKNAFCTDLTGLRIGLDCANGSASVSAEKLFLGLGAKCVVLANQPDGTNINRDCGSTHLEGLKELVVREKLDLGIAFDGDADRCLAIDEHGREIDGDYIMAILSLKLKEEGKLPENTVVGTVMSNFGFGIFCKENGLKLVSAKVGDRYVLEIMLREGYSFGGEQSGHLILSEHATTGDGQLTAVALLSHVKNSGKSLSTLASVMKKYPQYMINIRADSSAKDAFKTDSVIKEILAEGERKIADSGRILVRPSGTEPLIRIMTEGQDANEAEGICRDVAERIEIRLKELNLSV